MSKEVTHPLSAGKKVLAGDVGGTKVNLAIFKVDKEAGLRLVAQDRFSSRKHSKLEEVIEKFLTKTGEKVSAACFGIPGPVEGGRVKPSNLEWIVDASEICDTFEFEAVRLLNDLEANAYGLTELAAKDFHVLQKGAPDAEGNRAVISPGTGLGEAGLYFDGQRHHPYACEGGHTDFAPFTDEEIALFRWLKDKFGRVSIERVASGFGIANIYEFLRTTGDYKEKAAIVGELAEGDPGAVISKHAIAADCKLCERTMEMFVRCLGAEAGNMALKTMARGGIFIGGGIPGKILPLLERPTFLEAFNGKGRLEAILRDMRVSIILNDEAALLGAARCAEGILAGVEA